MLPEQPQEEPEPLAALRLVPQVVSRVQAQVVLQQLVLRVQVLRLWALPARLLQVPLLLVQQQVLLVPARFLVRPLQQGQLPSFSLLLFHARHGHAPQRLHALLWRGQQPRHAHDGFDRALPE